MTDAHRRTLDQLSTGVAIFTADQQLAFYNAAYRVLWGFDPAFLDQRAGRHRRARSAPRQPQAARAEGTSATGRTTCTKPTGRWSRATHEWHLPDGRTLRVVTTPNPEGGVTYLFDDVTERLKLVRRYESLIGVQGETLDSSRRRRRGVRQRRPARPAQSGVRDAVAARRAGALDIAERPHIEAVHELVPRRCTATRRSGRSCARTVTGAGERAPIDRAARAPRRQRARLRHRAAARRRHAGDVPRRHRHDERRARAARAQRGAARRRPAQEPSSCSTSPTSCARRSPPSSASRNCSSIRASDRASGRSPRSSASTSATSTRRPARCSRSSTTFSTSPPSMPAR